MITGHFVDAYEPVIDGVVRVTQSYREYMARTLGPSWVITPSDPKGPAREANVLRYASLPFVPPYRLGISLDPRVRAQIKRIRWDIAHAHSPFSAGELALVAARETGAPLVFTLHTRYAELVRVKYRISPRWAGVMAADSLFQPAPKDRLRTLDLLRSTQHGEEYVVRAAKRKVWNYAAKCACVIVSTPSARDELLSFAEVVGATRAPRIEIVRCGVQALPAHDLDVHARHRLPRVPLLLYVGQLADEKGLPFLLEAVARLRTRTTAFRLLIVGTGNRRAHFERRTRELGIADHCIFTGQISDLGELGAYFRAAALFAFPSRFETQGLVVSEAASVGLCTVGLRGAPGLSDSIRDGVNGFLAEPNVEAYAARLHALLAEPALCRTVGERARSFVRTTEAAAAEVVDLYRDLRGKPAACSSAPSSVVTRLQAAATALDASP